MIIRRFGGPFPGQERWADAAEVPEVIEMEWPAMESTVIYRQRTRTTSQLGEEETWFMFAGHRPHTRLRGLAEL